MTKTLTASERFDAMMTNDEWLGFGYLGGRRNARTSDDPEVARVPEAEIAEIDTLVAHRAAQHGWSEAQLFEWANSKNGRWFADVVFESGDTVRERFDRAVQWNLLRLPR